MTIKQHGGVFGRNPTFNNVTVDGTLTVDQIVEKTGAAGITLDGVTLKDGNVVLADGKGIDFSATSGTGTSELFDDYEEGTWTPVAAAGAITGTSITYTGTYTKIGRVVHLFFRANSATADIAVASYVIFSGLPFNAADNIASGTVVTEDVDVNARQDFAGISGGNTLFLGSCGGGTTSDLYCSITYYTS